MHKDKVGDERDAMASSLLPEGANQRITDRKQEMLELMRKENRAFKQRKIATIAYWASAIILFCVPVWVRYWHPPESGRLEDMFRIAGVAAYVLLVAAVVSTIALVIKRRPIKDEHILAALYDIDASLKQLVNDHKKQ